MSDKNKQPRNEADIERILDQFSDADRDKAEEIWQKSQKGRLRTDLLTEDEVEDALQNVHSRIDRNDSPAKGRPNIAGSILKVSRYLVAAIALIVFGFGIFMVPKTVTVPNGEIAVIELPDGSSVEMNSGSTIRYNRLFSFTNRTLTLNGEAYFSVEPGEEPFLVEANNAVVEVTGTEFNVRSWHNDPASETTVTVTDGTVQFYRADRKLNLVTMNKGQSSRLNTDMMEPSDPEEVSTDASLAWRENRLVFQETPFIVILNELERRFDVTIELDVEGMELESLTAYYNQPASIEPILEDLCTVKGLRYTKTKDGYRIFK